jgi:hypothetical protein
VTGSADLALSSQFGSFNDVVVAYQAVLSNYVWISCLFPQIASSIQWMMYLLARHPNLQDELYADLLEVHKPEDIVQLHLLRGMMREALRLYPVAPFLSRYLPEDSLIGGYRVPAGVSISSLYEP